MEKRNVVEKGRTPEEELNRKDEHWDKEAASKIKSSLTDNDNKDKKCQPKVIR